LVKVSPASWLTAIHTRPVRSYQAIQTLSPTATIVGSWESYRSASSRIGRPKLAPLRWLTASQISWLPPLGVSFGVLCW
jgi:hypothetical protein